MAEHITAHPPGLFGHIGGVEVALLTITRAGTFGAPVDYVTARRADVPAGTPEVSVDHAGPAELIRVPISVVDQLARWWWTVRLNGGEYQASQMRDGKVLIGTTDSRFVWGAGWDGNVRDGWQRWVDAEGLDATATRHPLRVDDRGRRRNLLSDEHRVGVHGHRCDDDRSRGRDDGSESRRELCDRVFLVAVR
ncbi:hypothetical protein [Microbacterium maritypicum]|uniref:Uncharacterized protein n=1 Tax=Microbacterium maritypicum TaxID=33918 RepID=A0ACD4B1E3_MICMQ|nr:hypothetical protein [Microbacterium liquefaciens]UTT51302.1 hypothetical protein NMQ05_09325 [Microbacterium liquefaciens]